MASSVFDMIGPIMIGPSSSHTAGVVRIGNVFKQLISRDQKAIEVTFYNSFATTYKGHGSDRAIVAGILGFPTSDARIRESELLAQELGYKIVFKTVSNSSTHHPNTIMLTSEQDGETTTLIGESLGGGVINISQVNGYKASFDGALQTMVIEAVDKPGVIAFVADVIAHDGANIASMTVSRKAKFGTASHIVEVDNPIRQSTIQYLQSFDWINSLTIIEAIS